MNTQTFERQVLHIKGTLDDLPPMPDWVSLCAPFEPWEAPKKTLVQRRNRPRKCSCGCGQMAFKADMVIPPGYRTPSFLFLPEHVCRAKRVRDSYGKTHNTSGLPARMQG